MVYDCPPIFKARSGTWPCARHDFGWGAGKSKGEEEGGTGGGAPAGFSSWISRELGRAEALLKVVGSRPDTLADNFFTLMPSGTLPDYQRIIDLKARRHCCIQGPAHAAACRLF